jgi:hypothetical protein
MRWPKWALRWLQVTTGNPTEPTNLRPDMAQRLSETLLSQLVKELIGRLTLIWGENPV